MGFQSMEIEGDAHMIIRRLIDAQTDRSIIGTYIIDGKQVVACFGAFRFRFCSKNINLVAHQQATKGFDFNEIGWRSYEKSPRLRQETIASGLWFL
ncbi:hypothetical protein Gotri_020642, partial [Gossypium trilobum]|nr:hypothetical protein [Gossypium trilobum]